MAAKMFYDNDADLSIIRGKKVAIIGYGSQGHAHALNLKDSGVAVKVGLRPTSKGVAKARAAGLEVGAVDEISAWADVVMLLAPDTAQPRIYRDAVAPHLAPGKTLMKSVARNDIVVPHPTDRRFYGHGIPGVDLERLAGKLIVVEGADGSGRSTQIEALVEWLEGFWPAA